MIISDVSVRHFLSTTRRHSDGAGHAHQGEPHQVTVSLLTIRTEDGHEGFSFAVPEIVRPHLIDKFVKKVLIGQDHRDRERLWQDLAHWHRAERVKSGACDILRTGVNDAGGITPALKTMRMAEAFGMDCEVHGNTAMNLVVTAASKNCRWYERGLLHPFLECDGGFDYLKSLSDPMDQDGWVHVPDRPGIGEDIDFDFIETNRVN